MTKDQHKSHFAVFACAAALLVAVSVSAADDIVSSFVFIGDNQVGAEQAVAGDESHANQAQLRQTFRDIAGLELKPSFLFFAGDIVDHGADDNGEVLSGRLAAWTQLNQQACRDLKLDLPMVPVPGNHEIMKVVLKQNKPIEAINPGAYGAWVKWLERDGYGRFSGNGPIGAPPNPDLLAGDNSHLTYSFDDTNGNHFILINTFTVNNQAEPARGWIPYNWIAEDARKAQANPRVRHIFAFGHMPIRIAGLPTESHGDNSIFNTPSQPLAQKLVETLGGLSKFNGYFCGHLHLWDCSRVDGTNSVWQVISGNSGSKPIARAAGAWQPPFYFGFTEVRIHRDGRVGVVSYRRPVPEPYYSNAPQPAARPEPEIFLTHRENKSGNAGERP